MSIFEFMSVFILITFSVPIPIIIPIFCIDECECSEVKITGSFFNEKMTLGLVPFFIRLTPKYDRNEFVQKDFFQRKKRDFK